MEMIKCFCCDVLNIRKIICPCCVNRTKNSKKYFFKNVPTFSKGFPLRNGLSEIFCPTELEKCLECYEKWKIIHSIVLTILTMYVGQRLHVVKATQPQYCWENFLSFLELSPLFAPSVRYSCWANFGGFFPK